MKAAFLLLVGLFLRACSSSEAEVTDEHIHSVLKATSRTNQQEWLMLHSQHVAEVEDGKGKVWDLVVYGDSITEAFRGTTVGFRSERWSENEAAWAALVTAPPPPARRYNAAVYSVSGDQAMHLLWRLQNGEGPRDLNPAVVMVQIGTNDIGHLTYLYQDDTDRVVRTVHLAQRLVLEELAAQAPGAQRVVVSLPPLQVPGAEEEPSNKYQAVLDGVNEKLQLYAAGQEGLRYADCTTPFYEAVDSAAADGAVGGQQRVNMTLLPDGVHPAGPGAWVLARCMLRALQAALGEGGS